jgi:hypothetical protein
MKRKSTADDVEPITPTSRPRKPLPHRLPGLKMKLPARKPWLKRCVTRWNLLAPFDTSNVTEQDWEAYYKERAALDWYTLANGLSRRKRPLPKANDRDSHSRPLDVAEPLVNFPRWKEDFPKPYMAQYPGGDSACGTTDFVKYHLESLRKAIKKTVDECPELSKLAPGEKDIGEMLASSIYVINGQGDWTDYNDPTDFFFTTRLYSPFGLGTSIDFELDFHHEYRLGIPENTSVIKTAIRSACHCSPSEPTLSGIDQRQIPRQKRNTLLFSNEYRFGRYQLGKMEHEELKLAEEALFGRQNLLSDDKMFSLLLHCIADVAVKKINKDLSELDKVHWTGQSLNFGPFTPLVSYQVDDSDWDIYSDSE